MEQLAILDQPYALVATSNSVHLLNLKTNDLLELTNLYHSSTSKYINLSQSFILNRNSIKGTLKIDLIVQQNTKFFIETISIFGVSPSSRS